MLMIVDFNIILSVLICQIWIRWFHFLDSYIVEHSDSEKNIPIRFSETNRFCRFDSAHHCRIGYYRLLCCQMSTLLRHHESLSQLHKYVGYNNDYAMAMIIDQANVAAELNGRFF